VGKEQNPRESMTQAIIENMMAAAETERQRGRRKLKGKGEKRLAAGGGTMDERGERKSSVRGAVALNWVVRRTKDECEKRKTTKKKKKRAAYLVTLIWLRDGAERE